jgi:hypothetical protein
MMSSTYVKGSVHTKGKYGTNTYVVLKSRNNSNEATYLRIQNAKISCNRSDIIVIYELSSLCS